MEFGDGGDRAVPFRLIRIRDRPSRPVLFRIYRS
jgi:hypothetical protein